VTRGPSHRILLNLALDGLIALLALLLAVWAIAPRHWPTGAWWAVAAPGAVLALLAAGAVLRLPQQYWRFVGLRDLLAVAGAALGGALLFWLGGQILGGWQPANPAFPLIHAVLLGTLLGLTLAMVLAGWLLGGLFREHATRQFQAELATHLEQLTARLAFDATGQPLMDPTGLADPRWQKPLSGRYWQVDSRATDPSARAPQAGVLRSRSLWDQVLQLPPDVVADGSIHTHTLPGPDGHPLLVLERSVRDTEQTTATWTLIVAADARDTQQAIDAFSGTLAASLGVLLLLLSIAATAQVWIGLAPLRALQAEVVALSQGQRAR
jgi:hypothetical protein